MPLTQETLLLSREKKAAKLRLKDDKEKFAFEAHISERSARFRQLDFAPININLRLAGFVYDSPELEYGYSC